MKIRYDERKATQILNHLSLLTGVRLALLDIRYNTVTTSNIVNPFCKQFQENPEAKKECYRCDVAILERCKQSGQMETHLCHAGLYDFAMPLKKDGNPVGFLIFGQIRSDRSPADCPIPSFNHLYQATPFYSREKINCLQSLLPLILFDDAITIQYDNYFDSIVQYITSHLQAPLNIDFLCKKFHVSKNSLYRSFHDNYQTTVNEFIASARIRQAQKLLSQTQAPVYTIAEDVGIANYTYFCRLFKKKCGMSPSAYRKQ